LSLSPSGEVLPAGAACCGATALADDGTDASLDAWLNAAVTGDIDDSVGLATSDTLSDSGAVLRTGAGDVAIALPAAGAGAGVEVAVWCGRGGVLVVDFVVGCGLGRVGVIDVMG
jgi:hypothetical protein